MKKGSGPRAFGALSDTERNTLIKQGVIVPPAKAETNKGGRPFGTTNTALRKLKEDGDSVIQIQVSPTKARLINRLLATGLFGGSAASCCGRLLDQKLFEILPELSPQLHTPES